MSNFKGTMASGVKSSKRQPRVAATTSQSTTAAMCEDDTPVKKTQSKSKATKTNSGSQVSSDKSQIEESPTISDVLQTIILKLENVVPGFASTYPSKQVQAAVQDSIVLAKQAKRLIPSEGFYDSRSSDNSDSNSIGELKSSIQNQLEDSRRAQEIAANTMAATVAALTASVAALSDKMTSATLPATSSDNVAGSSWANVARQGLWITPGKNNNKKRSTSHLLAVKPNNQNGSAQATKADFKEQLEALGSELGIKGIKCASNHTILVQTVAACDKAKVVAAFNNSDKLKREYTIEESKKKLPTVILRAVERKDRRDSDEFSKKLIAANSDLKNISDVAASDIKILYSRRAACRKSHLSDIVLRVSPQVRVAMLNIGRVNIDFGQSRVEDFVNVTQCFKCLEFGHLAKHCSNKEVCSHCAGEHTFKDCQEKTNEKLCCTNCKKNDDKNSDRPANSDGQATSDKAATWKSHSATSHSCRIFKAMESIIVARTDYGY